jgi:tetratricopeptide (TPR) repeat protein
MDVKTCFETLKVNSNASIEEVKEAHRNLAFLWHPDRYATKSLIVRKRAEREMQKINVAYETLVSFLNSKLEKSRHEEERAEAKAAAKNNAKEAQAKTQKTIDAKALYKKLSIPKVAIPVSFFIIIGSILIISYTIRDQITTSLKNSEDLQTKPKEAGVSGRWEKGQGATAPWAKTPPVTKETEVVVSSPELSRSDAGKGALKEERFAKAAAEAGEGLLAKLDAGNRAIKEERFAKALDLFKEILASDPSMIKEVSTPYSQALQGQASELVKTDPENAKSLLLAAIKLDPGSVNGHFQLGLLYTRMKDYQKAIETFQKAAKLDPQFPETFFNLGYVYATIKDYSMARDMYSRTVELAPPFLDEALFNLAFVHEKLGKRDESIKTLEHALKVNPENLSAKRYLQRLKRKVGKNR